MPTARNFTATQPFGASTNVGSLYYLMSMVCQCANKTIVLPVSEAVKVKRIWERDIVK